LLGRFRRAGMATDAGWEEVVGRAGGDLALVAGRRGLELPGWLTLGAVVGAFGPAAGRPARSAPWSATIARSRADVPRS
jgi:hypothetical protein